MNFFLNKQISIKKYQINNLWFKYLSGEDAWYGDKLRTNVVDSQFCMPG